MAMKDQFNSADSEWFRNRSTWGLVWAVAAFSVLLLRLFYLQIIEGSEYRRLSENNCIRIQGIDPPRGLIYERNGNLLVENRPSFTLSVNPLDAKPLEETINKISNITGVSSEEILIKVEKQKKIAPFKSIPFKQDISRDLLAVVEAHRFDLPGLEVDVRPMRNYILESSASHFLGYLGEINPNELLLGEFNEYRGGEYIGKFGVEKTYEKFLRGKRGGKQVEVNAAGQVVRVLSTVDAHSGHNLFVTIDNTIQQKAEQLLSDKAGAVVALDPFSGQVLVLASSPSFDQNAFVQRMSHDMWNQLIANPLRPMENKVIQAEYPPASTYKIVTAMAGLEEGVINTGTTHYCPGFLRFGDRSFRCWKKTGHGTVNIIRALAESCDVFFYQVGLKLGVDRLAWYAKACGLGSPTAIDLDHEASGLIPTASWKKEKTGVPWQKGETLSIAIGQGYNLTTPLQMAVLTAAIANGGKRFKPLVVDRIVTQEGEIIYQAKTQEMGRLPVSEKNLKIIQRGLFEVVQGQRGTASIAKIDGIHVAGKTGTAQVVGRKTESAKDLKKRDHFKSHAWFVAYAPAEKPKIAIAVIVEHGEHGSSAAAPIAREIIATYLNPGQYTTETVQNNLSTHAQ
jgi:penicillin-binding protein 2